MVILRIRKQALGRHIEEAITAIQSMFSNTSAGYTRQLIQLDFGRKFFQT